MSRYVLDNAVTIAWCFPDEATPATEQLFDRLITLTDHVVVPAIWLYEVTNVTMLGVRKSKIPKAKAITFLNDLVDLPIEIEPTRSMSDFFTSHADLMERHTLTAYDAAYLELALRRQLPLATFDDALIAACKTIGKTLLI